MSRSSDLRKAKENKADEFYTALADIEVELKNYKEYFKNKIVFCNCDDPFESNFFKYFALNFNQLGLKKLICTCYDSSPFTGTQLSLFDLNYEIPNRNKKAYKIEITEVPDSNGDGAIDLSDVEYLLKNKKNTLCTLKGDGDFRSEECIKLLKQSDIVVTNPPFSLFTEFISQLYEYKKDFLIIGNVNAINNRDIFPLVMDNKMWMGVSIHSGDREFRVPDSYPLNASGTRIDEFGNKYIRVKGVRWFTNLDTKERHEKMILYKKYNPVEYPSYFNFDGIDVNKSSEIPMDYKGYMGVPITFLDKYNPEQFRILGNGTTIEKKYVHTVTENKKTIQYIDKKTNEVKWTFPYTVNERKIGNGLRIERNGEPAESPYSRVIIENLDLKEEKENGN